MSDSKPCLLIFFLNTKSSKAQINGSQCSLRRFDLSGIDTADGVKKKPGNKKHGESCEVHSHISMLNFSVTKLFFQCLFLHCSSR